MDSACARQKLVQLSGAKQQPAKANDDEEEYEFTSENKILAEPVTPKNEEQNYVQRVHRQAKIDTINNVA